MLREAALKAGESIARENLPPGSDCADKGEVEDHSRVRVMGQHFLNPSLLQINVASMTPPAPSLGTQALAPVQPL
jgi:hypothetical protein